MAIIDEIERFEAGAARVRASAPSLAQQQDPVATPAPRPLASRPAPVGTRIGTGLREAASNVGGIARGAVNRQLATGLAVADGATTLPRTALGVARDAGRALIGAAPSPDAGQPLSLPRLSRRPAATAPAAPAAALPANWSAGPRSRSRPRPAAAATPAVAGAATATNFDLQPGDANTFTGGDGVTRPVPGLLNAASPTDAAGAQPVVAARPVAQQGPRGRQGAVIENPGDRTQDKLARALMSSSLKGSPSARNAVAQSILGEAGAVQAERASALAAGDRADLQSLDNAARTASANADRDLSAQQTNAELVERRADRQEQRLARRPDVTVASDGSMGIVSQEGRFTPVTDAAGRTVRAPQAPRQTGEATQGELLKSYTDRYNAIVGDVTTDAAAKQQAIAALDADPLYAGLRGGNAAPAAPALDEFLAAARTANPGVSDADLTAYYNQTYGGR